MSTTEQIGLTQSAQAHHIHLVVRDRHGNLSSFLTLFHSLLARSLNAHWGRWENLWSVEPTNAVWLVDAAARFDKLVYTLVNPVADHLVERVADWPGASSWLLHVTGKRSKTVKRPRGFFRKDGSMPDEVTLEVERVEGYEHLSDAEWREKLLEAAREAEAVARAERVKSGREVWGRKQVLRARPTDRPSTAEPRRNLRPTVACRNTKRRVAALLSLATFRELYRAALEAFRAGERDVVFPAGTVRMCQLGLTCATAPP